MGNTGNDVRDFTLDSSLGQPLTLIGASAGTGKTYSICAKIVYEVYRGNFELADLALVTFTKNAAQELKSRLRQFLQNPCKEISNFPFEVNKLSVQKALSQLDEASIGTLHSFAYEIIKLVGTQGNVEPARELGEDDFIKKRALSLSTLRSMRRPEMAILFNDLQLTKKAVIYDGNQSNFNSTVNYLFNHMSFEHAATKHASAYEKELAQWGSRLSSAYKMFEREAGLISNSTLIEIARDLTRDDSVVSLLRNRWKILVVDEFQDTDPVQWEMIKRGFILPLANEPANTKVLLVGDPKQSIYGFRGADIANYQEADQLSQLKPNKSYSLRKNYRSDQAVIHAINTVSRELFDGSSCDNSSSEDHSDHIVYEDISAHKTKRLNVEELCSASVKSSAEGAGVLVRAVDYGRHHQEYQGEDKKAPAWVLKTCLQDSLQDFSGYVQHCLNHGKITVAEIAGVRQERKLEAADIAVLVRTNDQAQEIAQCLQDAGIAYVIMKSSSVFSSAVAQSFRDLLSVLQNPHQLSRLYTVSLGCLGHKDSLQDFKLCDDAYEEMLLKWVDFSHYAQIFGFPKFWERLRLEHALDERLLQRPHGEELLIDALHISELLIAQWSCSQSLEELITWFDAQCEGAAQSAGIQDDAAKRKIPSDRSAVKIMTYHASKGLQFPLVLLPYILFNPDKHGQVNQFAFEVNGAMGRRLEYFDPETLKSSSSDNEGLRGKALKSELQYQQLREVRRLDYVALTRAEMLAVMWLPVHSAPPFTKLQKIIRGEDSSANFERIQHNLNALQANSEQNPALLLDIIQEPLQLDVSHRQNQDQLQECAARALQGDASAYKPISKIRTSFSGLAQQFHGGELKPELLKLKSSELLQDEGNGDLVMAEPAHSAGLESLDEQVNPMLYMPAGAEFGTLVHEAFELLISYLQNNRQQSSLSELCLKAATELCRYRKELCAQDIAQSLEVVFTTRLGREFDHKSLDEFQASECRSELDFDFLLKGESLKSFLEDLSHIWKEELPKSHPLYGYAELLLAISTQKHVDLQGVMTGSIDLLIRDGKKYYVLDWKTNRLSPYGELAYPYHYQQESMVHAMFEHHYPLQACIYALAVDRIIKTHSSCDGSYVAGAAYLFVRGMGYLDEDNKPLGVCAWSFPQSMIDRVQTLLASSLCEGC